MSSVLLIKDKRAVVTWLALCAFMVALMVLVGGYTRLSGSGLSITSWKPLHGTIPPLNDAQWQEEFNAYQQSPQYQKVNTGMCLEAFKVIFWPEFIHRLLGRIVGLVFFLPLVVFYMRGSLPKRLIIRLGAIFALGGLQGLIGWLMVQSGLIDVPSVSHIRLALHLGMAFTLLALMLWTLLDVASPAAQSLTVVKSKTVFWYRVWFFGLCLQIVLGAFTAGLHAGLIFNTWPTMNGQWLPDGLWSDSNWYINVADNLIMIQFLHRNIAIILMFSYVSWWFVNRRYVRNNKLNPWCSGIMVMMMMQVLLGILTLIQMVPLPLALAHQMNALVLFSVSVGLLHNLSTRQAVRTSA